jgi:tRNA synthetase class I (K)
MRSPIMDGLRPLTPYVVATGFTTALLGDERTLREFIVGEHMRERVTGRGRTAVLILIVDSYDALTDRQLRVGVNKDEALFERFLPYCGRPIAEIPDPFECHASYSDHFAQALRSRLMALDIHPILVDTYQAYRHGHYAPFVRTTFENYQPIQTALAAKFSDFTLRNLYRPQCPRCSCVDATKILSIQGATVRFDCERCGHAVEADVAEVKGKLGWKLDCAARWNLYGVDLEVFSKVHIAELGTLGVSRFISREFFGGRVPVSVSYGDVILDREVSYRLLEILPSFLLRKLFLTGIRRDLHITKAYVENFCQKTNVIAGMSYVDYVRRELPRRAIRNGGPGASRRPTRAPGSELDDPSLIAHGLNFARYFYGREHELRYPDVAAIASIDSETARALRELIRYALTLRTDGAHDGTGASDLIRAYMLRNPHSQDAYRSLRRLFRQPQGPSAAGLLASAPIDYLELVESTLALRSLGTESPTHKVTHDGGKK